MLHINEVCSENVPVQSSVHVLHVLLLSPCWAVRLSDEGIYRNAEGVSVKIGLRTKKKVHVSEHDDVRVCCLG